MHASTKHSLHGACGIGLDDIRIEAVLRKQVFLLGNKGKANPGVDPRPANGHLDTLSAAVERVE
jgi:hypothetical protein